MRKWTNIVRAFSVLTFAASLMGCQNESLEKTDEACKVGFYVGEGQTRTIMQPNGLSTVWQSGDKLALWAKNSSGEFSLGNQVFEAYGIDGKRGFFTSTLASVMENDTYTYYCCYPLPKSVDGTSVTFSLPSVQDGKVTGGADIMIADPVQFGPLAALPEPEDHTNMRMRMNRMMHQFRFYIPSDNEVIGEEKIERILLNFPSGVAGTVTLDVADKNVLPVLTESVADIQMNLAEPLGISGDEQQFACLAIAPKQFEEEDPKLYLKAYTDEQIAIFDPISLSNRNFLGGHSTPVRLNVKELVDFAGILEFKLNSNNLGENPVKITFSAESGCNFGDGASNTYVYETGSEIQSGEVIKFKFEEDEDAYMAFSGKSVTVTYESENAIVSEDITMPEITGRGKTSVSMNVPYLLFEDFSCVYKEANNLGNNDYSSSETSQPGDLLDGCMSHTGWNAARYWTTGNCMRINSRHQEVSVKIPFVGTLSFASDHHGRLDSCPLSGIKSGKSVKLHVTFDAGGNTNSGSSLGVTSSAISVAMHQNSGKLDGIPTGKSSYNKDYSTTLADFGDTYETFNIGSDFGDNAFTSTFPTYSLEITGAKSTSRICFYPTLGTDSGIGNAEFNVYIDNIKVKIVK